MPASTGTRRDFEPGGVLLNIITSSGKQPVCSTADMTSHFAFCKLYLA